MTDNIGEFGASGVGMGKGKGDIANYVPSGGVGVAGRNRRKTSSRGDKTTSHSAHSSSSHAHSHAHYPPPSSAVPFVDFDDLTKPLPDNLELFVKLGDFWYAAKILERKLRPKLRPDGLVDMEAYEAAQRNKKAAKAMMEEEGLDADGQHKWIYYVHYIDWDRRMDEWVTRDRLSMEKPRVNLMEIRKKHENDGMEFDEQGNPITAHTDHDHEGFTDEDLKAHEEATKVKNIERIVLGKYEMTTWYYSPFPEEYNKFSTLYFCEFCLAFFGYPVELERHQRKCTLRHPPGNEIYRSEEKNCTVAAFEVDGAREIVYCQNLSYLAKLFLDHKTLEYDCTPFLFYLICEVDARGYHIVGYFSKEKDPAAKNNLACILALPCHQRKGYGKLLISLSYELSKIERKPGSPEKPISDLGKVSYMSYWSATLIKLLSQKKVDDELSIDDISMETCITTEHIIDTLKTLNILVWYKSKWVFSMTRLQQLVEEAEAAKAKRAAKGYDPNAIYVSACRPERLHYYPYNPPRRPRAPSAPANSSSSSASSSASSASASASASASSSSAAAASASTTLPPPSSSAAVPMAT